MTGRPARRHDPNYKWVALSNTTLGVLMSAIDGSIVIISLAGDLRRHPPGPARSGQRQLPAVDPDGLPARDRGAGGGLRPPRRHVRAGPHVQRGVRGLHDRLGAARRHPVPRPRRGALAHRHAPRPGGRRRLPVRQFAGHPDRRVPARAAWPGPGDQRRRRDRRPVRRAGRGRHPGGHQLAAGLLRQRPGGGRRDHLGLPAPGGAGVHEPRARSTGGAT